MVRDLRFLGADTPTTTRAVHLLLALIAVVLAIWQRARAVDALHPDHDERPYLQAAFRYAERMAPGAGVRSRSSATTTSTRRS